MAKNNEIGKIIDTSKIVAGLQSEIEDMFSSVSVEDLIKKEDLEKITARFKKIEDEIKKLSNQKLDTSAFKEYRKEVEKCQEVVSEFFDTIQKGSSKDINKKFNDAFSSLKGFQIPDPEVPDFSTVEEAAEKAKKAMKEEASATQQVSSEAKEATEEIKIESEALKKLEAELKKVTQLKSIRAKTLKASPDKQFGTLQKLYDQYNKAADEVPKNDAFEKLKTVLSASKGMVQDAFYDFANTNINEKGSLGDKLSTGLAVWDEDIEKRITKAQKAYDKEYNKLEKAAQKKKSKSSSTKSDTVDTESAKETTKQVTEKIEKESEENPAKVKVKAEVDTEDLKKQIEEETEAINADDDSNSKKKSKSKKKSETETEEEKTKAEETDDDSTVELKPKLSETFKEDTIALVKELGIESEITLTPVLDEEFKAKADALISETKVSSSTDESDTETQKEEESKSFIELKPQLSETFKADAEQAVVDLQLEGTIDLSPAISNADDFKLKAEDQINGLGIEGKVNIVPNTNSENEEANSENQSTIELSPKLSESFKEEAESEVDKLALSSTLTLVPQLSESFKEEVESEVNHKDLWSPVTLTPQVSPYFYGDAEEALGAYNLKIPVNLEIKKGKKSLANTTKAIEESLTNEFSSFDKISNSIEAVTTKIGEKNKAIQEEGNLVDRVAANESTRFINIREDVQRLISSIETLTKLNPYVEQLQSLGSTFSSLQINQGFATGLKGVVSQLDKFGTKLESFGQKDINFDNLKTLSEIFPKLKISENNVKAIEQLQDSLVDLSGVLRELQQTDGGSYKFLDQISNLVTKSKELEHLAKIVSNYQTLTNLTGEASPKQRIKDQYSAYIYNLKEIIKLKKQVGNSDDASKTKLLNNQIRSLSTKNQWIKKNIASMLEENPELETATQNELNTVSALQKELETRKELNKLEKADRQTANAESADKSSLKSYYTQLKDNLVEVKKLTTSLGKETNVENQQIIQAQIDAYNEENEKLKASIETIYNRNSALKDSTTVDQNKISILNDEISTIQKLNEENQKAQAAAVETANAEREASQVVSEMAILEDSDGWQRALSVLKDPDYFKEAREGASSYIDLLTDIVSITAQIRRDDKTGDEFVSYKFTDSLGSSLTIGANGELLNQKTAVLDLNKAYTELTNSYNQWLAWEKKGTNQMSTQELTILNKYKAILDEIAAEYRTTGNWETGSGWSKDGALNEIDSAKLAKFISQLKELKTEYQSLSAYEKGTSDTKIEKFLNKVYTYMGKNTKAAKAFRTELETLIAQTKAAGKDVNLDEMMNQFLKIENAAASMGLTGNSFIEDFKKQANYSLSSFLSQYLSIQDVIRYAQSAISTIEDLDYALLDLSKTADMTEEQLNEFYYSANDSAKELGVTTEDIIDLASSWSRLGYNTNEEATKMAELTAKFAAISPGSTTDEAQTGMINVAKAWDMEASDLEDVIDKINVLGKKLPKRMVTCGALKCA